jgi:FkbM family methyltransferase
MTSGRTSTPIRHSVAAVMPRGLLARTVSAVYPRVEPELAALSTYMPRGGTAVDVGAWFGPWTRRMARYAERVVAIEAHPELAALLRRTVPQAEVIHAAASDEIGEIGLFVPPSGAAMGISSVQHGTGERITVPKITIDSLGLTDVRFIKMDVEGHELAALRGAIATIDRDRPLLLLELEERMQPIQTAITWLAGHDYVAWIRPNRTWRRLDGFDLVGHQAGAIRRVDQSFLRRLVSAHPRYINMVLFRPNG